MDGGKNNFTFVQKAVVALSPSGRAKFAISLFFKLDANLS